MHQCTMLKTEGPEHWTTTYLWAKIIYEFDPIVQNLCQCYD